MRRAAMSAILVWAVLVAGCMDFPRGDVRGKVTYQGEPISLATLMFVTVDNQVYRADLSEDGSYAIPGVPLGKVRVAVQQALPMVKPRPDPVGPGVAAGPGGQEFIPGNLSTDMVPLPEKYGHPDQSGLEFELTQAEQEWSVDLQ
jgi:hypothetical protein